MSVKDNDKRLESALEEIEQVKSLFDRDWQAGDRWVTVPDRMRRLGLERGTKKGKTMAWSAGAAVRAMWVREVGAPPSLEPRRKTCGSGTHCFAVYPSLWTDRIDAIISSIAEDMDAEEAAQGELFDW